MSGNAGDRFDTEGQTKQFLTSATLISAATSYGMAATAGYDLTGSFRPFAKFGVHRWKLEGTVVTSTSSASASISGTDLFFGAGVQTKIYKGLSVRAEFERFNLDDDEVNFFSAGVNYQF